MLDVVLYVFCRLLNIDNLCKYIRTYAVHALRYTLTESQTRLTRVCSLTNVS